MNNKEIKEIINTEKQKSKLNDIIIDEIEENDEYEIEQTIKNIVTNGAQQTLQLKEERYILIYDYLEEEMLQELYMTTNTYDIKTLLTQIPEIEKAKNTKELKIELTKYLIEIIAQRLYDTIMNEEVYKWTQK